MLSFFLKYPYKCGIVIINIQKRNILGAIRAKQKISFLDQIIPKTVQITFNVYSIGNPTVTRVVFFSNHINQQVD